MSASSAATTAPTGPAARGMEGLLVVDPESPPGTGGGSSGGSETLINSPSDEQKNGSLNRQQQHEGLQEGYYHSIPESGDALYVGIAKSGSAATVEFRKHSLEPLEQQRLPPPPPSSYPPYRLGSLFLRSRIPLLDTPHRRKMFVQACYLGIAAIVGTLARMTLAQLFGEGCRNPDSVGWLADDAALCVTAAGAASQPGGVVFADLPANLLGSFLMGLMQDGKSLDLAVQVPVAFVGPSSVFQAYDVFHTAIKTGFCGSLTTFSGWNSEMVVMIVGGEATHLPTQVWKALFGYVVGLETALGSYVFGRTVAWWLHQWRNPELALEQDAIKICKSHGVAVNHSLPVLERRYLHSLFEDPANDGSISSNHLYLSPTAMLTREELAPLTRWRDSTREARLLGSGEQAKNLMELETALLAERKDITDEMCSMASANGWDMHSMREWLSRRYNQYENDANVGGSGYQLTSAGVYKTLSEENSIWYSVPMAATLLLLCLSVLIFLLYFWSGAQTSYEITYRTMAYAMVYATPGALLRWGLSGWNGTLNHRDWNWLPIGTLAANILGAMVSISMIGWEYNLGMADVSGYWAVATVRAIKIGFSGCLTTVSTMVSEVHTLTQMRQDRGYKYILITLTMSCTLAMILFLIIV